jgi:glycosyltransferase involved in cell wall biosynthesis
MAKRILIFSLAYYPLVGGAEVAVKEITDRISTNDVIFDMVTVRFGNSPIYEKIGNINVHRIKASRFERLNKYLFVFSGALLASRLASRHKYDAIWSIMAFYVGFSALLFKITHPRIPFLLTLQEGDPIDYMKRKVGILYPFLKLVFKKSDRIQAISNYLADWAKSMGALCPVTVIPNGVDVERFINSDHKQPFDVGNSMWIITTSRLVEKNGVGDIIESLVHLSENTRLIILGNGPLEDKLKVKARELGVADRVVFEGFVAHEKLPGYLHNSDVFVRPSLSEGMGNSFIEAMAASIPVVATPVGGIVDFLEDGETGLFCDVKNPASIAQKVDKLIKDHESRDYIVKNALNMVKSRYHWDTVAKEMLKWLTVN